MDFFDRAYVINLPSRVDRRQEMTKELEEAGMPFSIGKVELFSAIRPESPGSFESIGCRGAFLSHLNVLKKAKEHNLRNVLVMEDDLQLRSDFLQYEEILLRELSEVDWDIVHFGYGPIVHFGYGSIVHFGYGSEDESVKDVCLPILQPFDGEIIGAQFYAVNAKALDKLINFFEVLLQRPAGHPDGGPMGPDGVFNVFKWQYPDTVRLIAIPSFGDQRSSRSDISPSWFDKLPILKSLVQLLRRLGWATALKNFLN
jgi:glycosyl transferase family 25